MPTEINQRSIATYNNVQAAKRINHFQFLYLTIAMFLFVFHANFGDSPITTERLGTLLLGGYWLFFNKKIYIRIDKTVNKILFPIFAIPMLLLLYSSILTLYLKDGISGSLIMNDYLNFMIFGGLGFFFIVNSFPNKETLMKVLLYIGVVQSGIIVLKLAIPSFANLLDTTLNHGDYFDYIVMKEKGYYGGLFCITSTGSLALAPSIISAVYYLINKKNKLLYTICYVFVCFAASVTARSGIFITLIATIFLIFFSRTKNKNNFKKIMVSLLVIALLVLFIIEILGLSESFGLIFQRFIDMNENGLNKSFFNAYFQNRSDDVGIPKISMETIIGTGISSGQSYNGTIISVDGGFLKSYCGVGLIATILSYLLLLLYLFKSKLYLFDKTDRSLFLLFFAIMLFGEFKEPFIFLNRFYMILYLSFVYFSVRETMREKNLCE